jgi:hypothetical protein
MPMTKELPSGIISADNFVQDTTYVANSAGTTIRGAGPDKPSFILGSNVTLSGINFTNGGIKRDKSDAINTWVYNCSFSACRNGIELWGSKQFFVRGCLFKNCNSPTWIGDTSDLTIENCELTEVGYGLKVFGDSSGNKNIIIRRNYIHDCGMDFMIIELQGAKDGWIVEENLGERLAYGGAMVDNDHSLVMSLPCAKSKNGVIRGNIVHAKKPRGSGYPDAWINGAPAVLEMGGDNTLVQSNWFDGGGVGMTCTDKDLAQGSTIFASIILSNNLVTNCFTVWNKNHDKQTVTEKGTNGPSAPPPSGFTSWSAYETWLRSVVGRGNMVNPTPVPTPTPVPGPVAKSIKSVVVAYSDGTSTTL